MKVLDLCRVVAAPTVTRLLTDLGAEVIKVDIDPAEARSAYDEPLFHVYLNRGKKGVILNLKTPADRQRFDALVADADMLVTNVSAGRLSGTGLSDDALRQLNPALVFTYLNLYGVTGPWADFKGYAEIANCAIGVSSLSAGWATAPSGAPPVNDPPWPYTDSMAGVLSAFGAVAALYDRGRRGRTYRVNTSLAQTALLEQMPFAVDGADVDPSRGRDTSSATYRIYEAADRPVFVAIAAADLPEALRRLGADSIDDLEARIAVANRRGLSCARSASAGRRPARSKRLPRLWRPTASGRGAACASSGRRRTSAPSSRRARSRVSPAPRRWPATPPASSAWASRTGGQHRAASASDRVGAGASLFVLGGVGGVGAAGGGGPAHDAGAGVAGVSSRVRAWRDGGVGRAGPRLHWQLAPAG